MDIFAVSLTSKDLFSKTRGSHIWDKQDSWKNHVDLYQYLHQTNQKEIFAKFQIQGKISTTFVVTDNFLTTTSQSENSETYINVWNIKNNLQEAGAVKIEGIVKQIMVKNDLIILDKNQVETPILMVYLVENNILIHKYNFPYKRY